MDPAGPSYHRFCRSVVRFLCASDVVLKDKRRSCSLYAPQDREVRRFVDHYGRFALLPFETSEMDTHSDEPGDHDRDPAQSTRTGGKDP